MARSKRDESPAVSQYGESGGGVAEGDIVEYDESAVESIALAQVEEADDDPAVTVVSESLFKARDAVEQSLGGFGAILASASAIEAQAMTGLENIMGFGIGEKIVGGRVTGDLCVKIYVMEKMPLSHLSDEAIVPSEMDGYRLTASDRKGTSFLPAP